MLKRHNHFFKILFFILDTGVVVLSWVLAYFLRFKLQLILPAEHVPSIEEHIFLLALILPMYSIVSSKMGLYQPMRVKKTKSEIIKIINAVSLTLLLVIASIYFFFMYFQFHYSRLSLIYFWGLTIISVSFVRIFIRTILRRFREKGYNLRHILIVGTGDLATDIMDKINKQPAFGINIVGFLSKDESDIGQEIQGVKVLGEYRDIKDIIESEAIDQVVFALPTRDERVLRILIDRIDEEGVDIKVALDLNGFFTLRKGVEELEGVPIISLRESPSFGWSSILKRLFDIVVSFVSVVVFAPVMGVIAVLVKATSSGPVFYIQERMGFDQKSFKMIKFRTMKVVSGAEDSFGWTKENDPRRTAIGKILRRTSLDELPQFINVLKGDMSLVGPRPERPEFANDFKKNIPRYILRNKVKGGMTGWAQIHGLRGDTSLEKRIEKDVDYIENWSFLLDLKILGKTIPSVLKGKGAY